MADLRAEEIVKIKKAREALRKSATAVKGPYGKRRETVT